MPYLIQREEILHLTLKKFWFDMIYSGEKKEEYRQIKQYWTKRFNNPKKNYKYVFFKNGYSKEVPAMLVELKSITIGTGKIEWGAPSYKVYILHLGKILIKGNY